VANISKHLKTQTHKHVLNNKKIIGKSLNKIQQKKQKSKH